MHHEAPARPFFMDQIAAFLRDGLSELEELQGKPFFRYTNAGQNFDIFCVENSGAEQVLIDVMGNQVVIRKRLFVQGQRFLTWGDTVVTMGDTTITMGDQTGPVPLSGRTIKFPGPDGPTYQILQVTKGPGQSHLIFDLGDPNSSRAL